MKILITDSDFDNFRKNCKFNEYGKLNCVYRDYTGPLCTKLLEISDFYDYENVCNLNNCPYCDNAEEYSVYTKNGDVICVKHVIENIKKE